MEALKYINQLEQLPEPVKDAYFNEHSTQSELTEALETLKLYGYRAHIVQGKFELEKIFKISFEHYIEDLVSLNLHSFDITEAIKFLTKEEKQKAVLYLKFAPGGEYLDVLRLINSTI